MEQDPYLAQEVDQEKDPAEATEIAVPANRHAGEKEGNGNGVQ